MNVNPTITATTAIALVNALQMETLAWRLVFKRASFPLDEQQCVTVVAVQGHTYAGKARTMETYSVLADRLNKSEGACERRLRKIQGKYVVQRQDALQGNVHYWHIKDDHVRAALAQLAVLKLLIYQVVAAQVADPTNPVAGKDLLPEDVRETIYFNVVANQQRRSAPKPRIVAAPAQQPPATSSKE